MTTFRNKHQYEKIIKGTVTKVIFQLLHFEIDDKFRIYIDITKCEPQFPTVGDVVEIVNPKIFHGSTYTAIIGPLTKCQFSSISKLDDTSDVNFFNCLKVNNCDENELIAMDCILRKLENFLSENISQKLLKCLLEESPFKKTKVPGSINDSICHSFEKVKIKLPSNLDYVNGDSNCYKFLKFYEKFYYGVFPSQSMKKVTEYNADFLFGLLEIDPYYGWFMLKDINVQIPLKFYKNTVDPDILGSYVLIKKWTVFTEIFDEKNVPTLKYIVLNLSDISIIHQVEKSDVDKLLYSETDQFIRKENSLLIQTLRKSEIVFGYNNAPECWIEVLLYEKNNEQMSLGSSVFIILYEKYLKIFPFLKEGMKYRVYYNTDMEKLNITFYKELYGLRTAKHLFKISKDAIFQETSENCLTFSPVIDDVLQLNQLLCSSESEIISISLKVSKKTIQNSNFPSFVIQRHKNVPYFGTPGSNNQLHLELCDSNHDKHIILYFTDRNNYRFPLGLITDMVIVAKHVQIYKSKCLKTTVFTYFEILEYCPKVWFSSVSLSFSDRSSWQWKKKTPQVLLGMHEFLPRNCIVNGKFLLLAIFNLRFSMYCHKCGGVLAKNCCPSAETYGHEFKNNRVEMKMSLLVQDAISASFKVYTENEDFLFELLGLKQEREVLYFLKTFSKIGSINIDFARTPIRNDNDTQDNADFLYVFTEHIRKVLNFKQYPFVDAVCVRQNIINHPWKMIEFSIME